ncbi:hypothetical protein PF010_g7514 [Phytophthora fragariae]|uniref:Uncharacterized protein n=1 Tax=Phytophthora fragariae TaxID=53985 RepID=A0A6A4DIL1_9STRA|nr:hypothetical protein PF003_g35305 [Phytophthora fragariae]KAE8934887.1 hypothetical protein PF009_g15144 [Phytophthora fragariae]KAE9111561.1 hypothetical protein PF007_g11440 [Phytophthora fragariae]KAE9120372.1 hypothetical protein PF010_g7514 [Phytophthora fragariae]KAE9308060.1 hypothetical protein PF001_g11328 [Phytophthora fragariae]
MKSFEITKSNAMACTACSDIELHQMRYRLLACNSEACDSAGVFACPWRGKALTCLKNDEVSIYEFGEHASGVSSPKKKKLTGAQKEFCRELTNNHLRPMRIRDAMARKFEIALEELPALTTVQNFVNHYSRTYLVNNDRVDDLRDWIHARAFTGEEQMAQAFAFGWVWIAMASPLLATALMSGRSSLASQPRHSFKGSWFRPRVSSCTWMSRTR